MPGFCLGQTYKMNIVGPFLDHLGQSVIRYENKEGNDYCVTKEWYQEHKQPARIMINTKMVPAKITALN